MPGCVFSNVASREHGAVPKGRLHPHVARIRWPERRDPSREVSLSRSPTNRNRPRQRLSPMLERELVLAAEAGDAAACTQLVEAFLPAIAGVARLYRSSTGVDRS